MADKNEVVQVYRCIIRIEMRTDKLAIAAQLIDELQPVLQKFGAKLAENVNLPETTTPPGRA